VGAGDQVETLSVGADRQKVEQDQAHGRWLQAEAGRTMIAVHHEEGLETLLAKWKVVAGWQDSFRT